MSAAKASLCQQKDKPYTCACGIDIDFDEEHHDRVPNCFIRGKVKRIRSVFVDRFAGTGRHIDLSLIHISSG